MATTIFSEAAGVKDVYVLEGEGRQDKITEVQARIRNRNRTDNKKWVRLDQKETPPTPAPVLTPAEVQVMETDMDAVIERDPVTALDDEAVNEDVTETAEPVIVDQPAAEPADAQPVKRGRGRPKKDPNAPVTPKVNKAKKVAVTAPKRKRGRPAGSGKAKAVVIAGKKGKRGRPPGVKNKAKTVKMSCTLPMTVSDSNRIVGSSLSDSASGFITPLATSESTLRLMISELFAGVTSITITRGTVLSGRAYKGGKRGRPVKAK